jgi:hypothetical protein
MADERDPRLSTAYRELGAEEPPRVVDEAILAASRRAVGRTRKWYGPVALAATLLLVVAVTVQIERRDPDEEIVAATAPPQAQKEERAAPEVEAKKPALSRSQPFTPEPPPAAPPPNAGAMRDLAKSNEAAPAQDRARADQAPASPPVVAEAAPPPQPARREMESPRPQASAAAGARAMDQMQSKVEAETPEPWLARIVELRKQGKQEEADKALAEFRKRYPEYRISEEMRAKVERPQ